MDHLYQVDSILIDGETVVTDAKSSPGGSAANTIYGLAKLGMSTGFIGAVGDDADGKAMLDSFRKVMTDTSRIKVKPGAKTGSVLCLIDTHGRRSLYVSPGANSLLSTDDLDIDYVNQAGTVHITSFADDRQFEVLTELMDRISPSVKVSFAPGALYAVKGLKALTPILSKTHILFINEDEIQQLTKRDTVNGAERCIRQGCRIVVVTQGKLGCYIRDVEEESFVESIPPEALSVLDTTGAGDAFAAGFLYGLLHGKELDVCGQLGNIVAQFCIRAIGAREGLPSLIELTQRYEEIYGHL